MTTIRHERVDTQPTLDDAIIIRARLLLEFRRAGVMTAVQWNRLHPGDRVADESLYIVFEEKEDK